MCDMAQYDTAYWMHAMLENWISSWLSLPHKSEIWSLQKLKKQKINFETVYSAQRQKQAVAIFKHV